MELRGRVHSVGETQQVTESFKKRELILEYADNPTYPQYIKLEANQDRVSIFDGLVRGQEVEVSINLTGRLWTDKHGVETSFNSLVTWRVTKLGDAPIPEPVDISGDGDVSGLPF